MAEYIEREAVLEKLCSDCVDGCTRHCAEYTMLKYFPAADVRPVVRGKWIWDDEGYHCSGCWFHAYGNTLECMDGTYRFCPNCGAEMEEE